MKYAIIGTHGVGKTTLAYKMAAEIKSRGKNVKIINETARSCPFPLNDAFSKEGALWIFHSHIKKELEAARNFEFVVCDRSCLDSFMYAEAAGLFSTESVTESLYAARKCALNWMSTYGSIIYVKSDGTSIQEDGMRSTDAKFQTTVEYCFDQWVNTVMKDLPICTITSRDVFQSKEMWYV